MKKIVFLMIVVLLIGSVSVFAGDIPESLMYYDYARVFFAEVEPFEEDSEWAMITPVKVIKGDVKPDLKQSYSKPEIMGDFEIEEGKVYLVTHYDEVNPTYIFETTTQDTKTLKIKHIRGDMWERFEEYLNDGEYERAEKERQERAKSRTLTEILDSEKMMATEVGFSYRLNDENDGHKVEVSRDELFELLDSVSCQQIPEIINGGTNGFFISIVHETGKRRNVFISEHGLVSRNDVFLSVTSMVEPAKYRINQENMEKLYALAGVEIPKSNTLMFVSFGFGAVLMLAVCIILVLKRRRRK